MKHAIIAVALLSAGGPAGAQAQTVTQRGFVDVAAVLFPQDAARDAVSTTADLLAREELFARPRPWLQLAGGIEARGNSHEQVDRRWRVDLGDRGLQRPALAVRRLTATLTRGSVTLDVGKQFIRWGKADIVTPTDHFAPRDFLNVITNDFLAVSGVRVVAQRHNDTFDAVWVPRLTPSRMPLIDQRWTVLPAGAASLAFVTLPAAFPARDQIGARWSRNADGYEWSVSAFDGVNHLPDVVVQPGASPLEVGLVRRYPRQRSLGVDAAVPTRWFTVKGEVAVSQSPDAQSDDYVLYVVQLERQTGEWTLLAGYAGEWVTERRVAQTFAPDRGLTRAVVARVAYTLDTNRSLGFETAVRQNARGLYAKGEYSQARGQHWRATLAGVAIGGRDDDFLGQYRRNSNVSLSLRYSF